MSAGNTLGNYLRGKTSTRNFPRMSEKGGMFRSNVPVRIFKRPMDCPERGVIGGKEDPVGIVWRKMLGDVRD